MINISQTLVNSMSVCETFVHQNGSIRQCKLPGQQSPNNALDLSPAAITAVFQKFPLYTTLHDSIDSTVNKTKFEANLVLAVMAAQPKTLRCGLQKHKQQISFEAATKGLLFLSDYANKAVARPALTDQPTQKTQIREIDEQLSILLKQLEVK